MIRIFYVSLFLSLGLAVMALYGGTEHGDLMRYVVQILITLQIGLVGPGGSFIVHQFNF